MTINNQKFNAIIKSIKSSTANLQDALVFAFDRYAHGDTSKFKQIGEALLSVKSRDYNAVVTYIRDHANVKMTKEGDVLTFKKAGKKGSDPVIKPLEQTWKDYKKAKADKPEKSAAEKKAQYAQSVAKRMADLGMTTQELLSLISKSSDKKAA